MRDIYGKKYREEVPDKICESQLLYVQMLLLGGKVLLKTRFDTLKTALRHVEKKFEE